MQTAVLSVVVEPKCLYLKCIVSTYKLGNSERQSYPPKVVDCDDTFPFSIACTLLYITIIIL